MRETADLTLTVRGAEFIARFEGFASKPYQDAAGHPTIGFGHKIRAGERWDSISHAAALDLLAMDASQEAKTLSQALTVPVKPHEADALISLAFNVGASAIARSTLLLMLNNHQREAAADQFLRWNKVRVNGVLKPLHGLMRRRIAERLIFLFADYGNGDRVVD